MVLIFSFAEKYKMASDEQRLHIGGVPLKFPFKPYPTQLSMMAKVESVHSMRAQY